MCGARDDSCWRLQTTDYRTARTLPTEEGSEQAESRPGRGLFDVSSPRMKLCKLN